MNLDIKYWDPKKMREGAVVLVIGRRGSGKSTLGQDILSYNRKVKRGVCISATERVNPFWSKYIPSCFIHHDWDENIVKDLFKMQQKCKKKLGYCEPAFAIFDDLMFDKSFVRSKQTRKIFMNGRHDKIFTIVTTQYIMDVPPDLRANIDYVLVLRDNIRANRERIYLYFAGVFPTFAAFDEVMQQCTTDNEALVLDQTSLSYNISDCVFFYKATPDLKYRVGAPEYWEFSKSNQKLSNEDSDDDMNDDKKKKSHKSYRIKKRYPTTEKDS